MVSLQGTPASDAGAKIGAFGGRRKLGLDKAAQMAQYVYMHRTIRIRPETYPKLKLICAILGVKLVVLLDEFADAKLAEAQKDAPAPTRNNKHSPSASA